MIPTETALLQSELARVLGVRRTATLLKVMRRTRLAPEALLDIALELLDVSSERFAVSGIHRMAVGLGAARWRNVPREERSEILRRAAEARWAKERGEPWPPEAATPADRKSERGTTVG